MTPSREYIKFLVEAKETLLDCYRYSRNHFEGPAEVAELLIDAIGAMSSAEIVSALILVKGDWDARISPANRKWAAETCEHSEEELCQVPYFWYCDEIHPTHFNQIADCLRKTIKVERKTER